MQQSADRGRDAEPDLGAQRVPKTLRRFFDAGVAHTAVNDDWRIVQMEMAESMTARRQGLKPVGVNAV